MKKIALLGVFVLTAAHGATTGNLLLKGSVPALLSITVTPESLATSLPLDTTQSAAKVASVNEQSNSNTGYSVSISSSNQGKLVHESVSASAINYSLAYGGNVIDLESGDSFVYASPESVDTDKDIEISYTGVPHEDLIQGNYMDTVTFTISAN